jgi:hypothetical protein
VKQLSSILAKVITGVAPSNVSLFGASPTLVSGLDVTASVNTLTFNRVGNYLIELGQVTGTGLFTVFAPVLSGTAAAALQAGNSNAAANVGTLAMASILATVTARGQTVIIDCTTQATTITASVTRIAGFAASFP